MAQEIEYDQPGIATFSFLRSRDAQDQYKDLINNIGELLNEKKLIDKEVKLPDKKKLMIKYFDYAYTYPIRMHPDCWIDDGDHLAGVHPKSSLPFFINSSGSILCRLCTGRMNIEEILREIKGIWLSTNSNTLLRDALAFLLLLEEMDLLEFKGVEN